MALKTKPQTGAGRIFKNPVLEALTKTHIAIPLVLFWSIGAVTLWYSIGPLELPWSSVVLFFIGGIILFTLVEYLMHRFLYHIPADTPRGKRFQYVIHGIHHEHPRDKERLAMPPVVSIVLAALFIGLFRLSIGQEGYAFGGGFLFGYSTYLLVHYSVHIYKQPRSFLGVLWKHHNLHHYVGDDGAFGVSSPFWDYVFGTMPKEPRRKKAQEVNTL